MTHVTAINSPFVSLPDTSDDFWLEKAKTLSEALPYMKEYAGSVFVVKYGGHAMGTTYQQKLFARDMVLLKQVGIHPVIVHGGGPQISEMLARLNIKSHFIDGYRVTDKDTIDIIEMVLSGNLNKQIVSAIQSMGGQAIGLSGKDGHLIEAKPLYRQKDGVAVDLGFVGQPYHINTHVIEDILDTDFIPVISPIGMDANGQTYNVNADQAAGHIAAALEAKRLFLMTDVAGVLDGNKELIRELRASEIMPLIENNIADGGMIPKLETCVYALQEGVEGIVILDGRTPHSVLLEVFTEPGFGTLLRPND